MKWKNYTLLALAVLGIFIATLVVSRIPDVDISRSFTEGTEITAPREQLLAGFDYYRPVDIDYAGSTLTDYQVNVTVDTASIISAGKMQSDCADIRFTDSDQETQLDYYPESGCNGASTKLWVKVPSIADGGKTIYMYYDSDDTTNASSINDTFDMYETFEGGLNGWSDLEIQTGSPGCDAGVYPDRSIDSSTGSPSPSIHKGPEQPGFSNDRLCWVGFNKSISIPGGVNLSVQVDGRTKSDHVDATDLYLRIYEGHITTGNHVFTETLVPPGVTLDSGWDTYGPYEDTNTDGLTQANIFFFITDPHASSWEKEIWVDNLKVRKIVSNHPTTSVGDELGARDYEFTYNKPVTISHTGTTLTSYQVNVTVDTATLISEGKMQSDCDDVEFTDSDRETGLNYWLQEGCNTTSTKFWVKVPSIPDGVKTVYMYYGNSTATSGSDPEATLMFWDDFSGSSLNTDKWDVIVNEGTVTVTGGYLELARPSGGKRILLATNRSFPSNVTIEYRQYIMPSASGYYFSSVAYGYQGTSSSSICYSTWSGYESALYTTNQFYAPRCGNDVSTEGTIITNPPASTWFFERFDVASGTSLRRVLNNVTSQTSPSTGVSNGRIVIEGWSAAAQAMKHRTDWMLVRKFATPEPIVTVGPDASSYLTPRGGGALSWSWGTASGPILVRSGTPYDWTWQVWTPSSDRKVPVGTPYDWVWGSE